MERHCRDASQIASLHKIAILSQMCIDMIPDFFKKFGDQRFGMMNNLNQIAKYL